MAEDDTQVQEKRSDLVAAPRKSAAGIKIDRIWRSNKGLDEMGEELASGKEQLKCVQGSRILGSSCGQCRGAV